MKKNTMIQRWTALLLAAILIAASVPFASAKEQVFPSGLAYEALREKIEACYAEKGNDNGLMVAVFDRDETVYEGYFGYANKQTGQKTDETTVIDWGSVSKLVVWLSVMQLKEQSLLDLNEDIQTYLPKGFLKMLRYKEPITMLHLMNHTAGFEDSFKNMTVMKRDRLLTIDELYSTTPRGMTLETYLRKSQPHQIFRPGETVSYSNYGCALAAYIVERITDTPFSDYARAHVFEPLGMKETALSADLSDQPSVQKRFRSLWFYNNDGSALEEKAVRGIWEMPAYPAGHCTSTLRDFEAFAKALLVRDARLLSAKTFEEFFSPSRYYTGTERPRNSHGMWWEPNLQAKVLGHGGNTLATASLLLASEDGVGMVLLTNTSGEGLWTEKIPQLLFGTCRGEASETVYYCCSTRFDFHGAARLIFPFACNVVIDGQSVAEYNLNVLTDRVETQVMDCFYNAKLNRFGVWGYCLWLLLSAYKAMPGESAPLIGIPGL